MRSQPAVLVVDEDRNVRSAYRLFLRGEKYRPVLCSSVTEALQKMNRQKIDIVITEICFDGFVEFGSTLLTNVRHRFPNLPIIVVSHPPDDEIKLRLKSLGVDTVLSKPVDLGDLKRMIKSLIHL